VLPFSAMPTAPQTQNDKIAVHLSGRSAFAMVPHTRSAHARRR
jgi:hypothetical protein